MAQDFANFSNGSCPSPSPKPPGSNLAAYLGFPFKSDSAEAHGNGSHSPSLSPKSSPLHTSNDTLNSSSASVSSGLGSQSNVSFMSTASWPPNNIGLADYLSQLLKDKKQLSGMHHHCFFHLDRLLDEEINKVRVNLFQTNNDTKEPLCLPDEKGTPVTLTEKVYVPVKEYPDYNFVGRILGPRGMTAKQLEKETGCKIMIRGKGSMRDKQKEMANRGKPNWEHLNDELHVLINVEDTPERAKMKLERAVDEVKRLLVPVTEADDELKKRQLMELAIINGTYRDGAAKNANAQLAHAASQYYMDPTRLSLALAAGQLRAPTLGSPLLLQTALQQSRPSIPNAAPQQFYQPQMNDAAAQLAAAGLVYPTQYDYAQLAALLSGNEYQFDPMTAVGGAMKQARFTGAREHPYARANPNPAAAAHPTQSAPSTSNG